MELVYVADPMCSWCWGFSPVLRRIVEYVAGRLPLRLLLGGLRPGPAARPLDDALRGSLATHWREVHELTGQPFDRSGLEREGFVYDTDPPARAVVAVRERDPGRELAFFHAIQEAFYAGAVDVTDPNTWPAIAARVGVDGEGLAARASAARVADATRRDYAEAMELGIRGFPALLTGSPEDGHRLLMMGYTPYEELAPRLARITSADRS